MGIKWATIADSRPTISVLYYKNGPAAAGAARASGGGEGAGPQMSGMGKMSGMGMAGPLGARGRNKPAAKNKSAKGSKVDASNLDESQPIPLTDFVVEFVWQDVPEEKQEAADPNPIKLPAGSGGGPGQPLAVGPNAANAAPNLGGNPLASPPTGTPGGAGANPPAPAGTPPGVTPQGGTPPGGSLPGGTPPGGGIGAPPAGGVPAGTPAGAGPAAGPKPN